MKIVVLVKQVPDTWGERKLDIATGRVDRSSSDRVIDDVNERAIEVALSYKDSSKATEVVLVSMGPSTATEVLRKGLSMGADAAIHVLDDGLAGSDVSATARVLAAAVKNLDADLIVAGNESTDGRGGVIPAMLAEHLHVPHVTFLSSVDVTETTVTGIRSTESGTITVHATLPAVISVTEQAPEARFPGFKGIMSAKKKPLTTASLSDLGLGADQFAASGRSVVVSTIERPARSVGRKIVDDGNAAKELADFLAAGHLI
jgi:electron transfer flavoprotein beta subunit